MYAPIKAPHEKYCFECAAVISARAEICPRCGVRQPGMGGFAGAGRNRVTAGLLAILLGSLGAHKFYLGRTGWGILYLLFCFTFLPGILGLIEGVQYLAMTDEGFHARYG